MNNIKLISIMVILLSLGSCSKNQTGDISADTNQEVESGVDKQIELAMIKYDSLVKENPRVVMKICKDPVSKKIITEFNVISEEEYEKNKLKNK